MNSGFIQRCLNCRLVFLNPQPSPNQLTDFYEAQYHKQKSGYGYKEDLQTLDPYYQKKIERLSLYKGKKLLDIGTGSGQFLEAAERKDFIAQGIEVSKKALSQAKSRGLLIKRGDFETLGIRDKFDIITLFQVLEHFRDPLKAAKKIYRLLEPGGIVIIATPNQESSVARFFGKKWWGYRPEHLFLFNPQTLRLLLQKAGFSQIEICPDIRVRYSPRQLAIGSRKVFPLAGKILDKFLPLFPSWPKIPFPVSGIQAKAIKIER